jgi:DNA polymerase III subunit alpha
MAVLQIEDLTGHAEAVIFPKSYERIHQYIVADARLMVWGKVDRRDERVQLIIDDVEPVDEIQLLMVELEPKVAVDIQEQHRLKTVLLDQRGEDDDNKIPVIAVIASPYGRQLVRLGVQFCVHNHNTAVAALNQAGFSARATSLTSA